MPARVRNEVKADLNTTHASSEEESAQALSDTLASRARCNRTDDRNPRVPTERRLKEASELGGAIGDVGAIIKTKHVKLVNDPVVIVTFKWMTYVLFLAAFSASVPVTIPKVSKLQIG